ncbi:hypothetical protein B0O99DRAFT_567957 [Bisporella sp. PMI_857]|nr:hypothetical protein B0O99DRAFT_567957 [Bisporella sp. PMI_857]
MIISLQPLSEYLFYRRPDFVQTPSRGSSIMESDSSTLRTSGTSTRGIPERLSFEKILNHETCPPCTTLDFYYYLNHKVHCAETLQFFLWLRDYTHRYNRPGQDNSTQPLWTHALQEEAVHKFQREISSKKIPMSASVRAVLKGTDFADDAKGRSRGDSNLPPHTAATGQSGSTLVGAATATPWDIPGEKDASESGRESDVSKPQEERDAAIARAVYIKHGLHYPFFHPSFRRELETIVATYIGEDGRRQLNLSAQERFTVLCALQKTADPSAFFFISKNVEGSLRQQHHPNFIIDAICNGNRPRVIFARALGAALITIGIVLAIIFSLSSLPRRYRAISAVFWILGLATSIAAWKGMCVVLHGLHHRHVRPWEMFMANGDLGQNDPLKVSNTDRNDVTTEYWVERYRKRNIVRKVFDREVWVQEPALRQIQDWIFVQALVVSLLVGIVATCIWVFAIPIGRRF